MADYIKREAAKRALAESDVVPKYRADNRPVTDAIIDAIPAADVVPVVRCRDCRSYNKPRLGWCSVHLDRENPDDFCSYGVRRDGDDDALD